MLSFTHIVETVGLTIDGAGVLVIVLGLLTALYKFLRSARATEDAFRALRQDIAYSGERERPFWLNVNTFFLNASPTGVCTPGVHVQSIS